MVRMTTLLCRVPVIKFKKGGLGRPAGPPAAAAVAASPGSCPVGAAPSASVASQPAVAMSTIPDIDLPARYRRQPPSEEEIDHINGGGDDPSPSDKDKDQKPKMLGMLKIPKGVLVSGKSGPELVTLNIVLQKQEAGNRKRP